ncbi:MAG: nucleotidyltransferase domain-containing protein [Nanoarchaeota archaeon]|nr:nucleotidyltransferase domain-containing protein [Nanoarchaeota archaeon]
MKTKLKTIELLEQNKNGLHLRELSRLLKTGMPNVTRYADILEKEDVVIKQREANLVKLRLKEHPRTIAYLKEINTERFLALPKKIQTATTDFLNELEIKPLITIIFGSYAKGNYTLKSDIDILLIFQKVEDDKHIENTAKRIGMRTNIIISPVYLDYKTFENNFLNKDHDFSKEIRQKVIVLSGTGLYYSLLWRFLHES